jgi:hypothetical protein
MPNLKEKENCDSLWCALGLYRGNDFPEAVFQLVFLFRIGELPG